jgi:site-specific DNA-adenine methylase
MKKLKPIFKINNSKWHIHNWIIEHFPPNYEKLQYLDLIAGDGVVLLNKEPSVAEYLNDQDTSITRIFRSLRDEGKVFLTKVRRAEYAEKTFEKAKTKTAFKDSLDEAATDFMLRRMSRSGEKNTFLDSENSVQIWNQVVTDLPDVVSRIAAVRIFNKPPLAVLKAFDEPNVLAFVNLPELVDGVPTTDIHSADAQIHLASFLSQFQGKAIVSGQATALNKRLYADWKTSRKKVDKITEALWYNY